MAVAVQHFIKEIACHLVPECLVISSFPWSTGDPPKGVITFPAKAMDKDSEAKAALKKFINAVVEACRSVSVILVPNSGESNHEVDLLERILAAINHSNVNVPLFFAHLLPERPLTRAMLKDIMERQCQVQSSDYVDDVITVSACMDVAALRLAINTCLARIPSVCKFARETCNIPEVSDQQLRRLEEKRKKLLWDEIPRISMPAFCRPDPTLVKDSRRIGDLTIESVMDDSFSRGLYNCTRGHERIFVRAIHKASVNSPAEVENIYREYRLLTEVINHPNVVQYLDCVQSSDDVISLFQHAGTMNVKQLAETVGGEFCRLTPDVAMNVFGQLAAAVAHCHGHHVAHRNISLEHCVVNCVTNGKGQVEYALKLVDFRHGLVSPKNTKSILPCGSMPCMCPEMLASSRYVPQHADCWSLGVIMLEISAGLTAMSRSVPYDPHMLPEFGKLANSVVARFAEPGSHAKALGNVNHNGIALLTQKLLQPDPMKRISAGAACRILPQAAEMEAEPA